jgi:transposase-like protein
VSKMKGNDYAEYAQELSAESEARISVEAIKAQKTITELAQLYQVNPNLIAKWKK